MSSVLILEGEIGRLVSSGWYWNGLFDWEDPSRCLFAPVDAAGDKEGNLTSFLTGIPAGETAVILTFESLDNVDDDRDDPTLKLIWKCYQDNKKIRIMSEIR